MDAARVLALYDSEERMGREWPGMRREVTPHVIRQLDLPGRESFINCSFMSDATADEGIAAQIDFFERAGQHFEWKVYEHDEPRDLRERLVARGFEAGEEEAVMALELAETPAALLRPTGHDVRRVESAEGIRDLVSVQDAVWEQNRAWLGRQLAEEFERTPDELSMYVAYFEGVAAASGWVRFPAGGSFASLWGGSTLPASRRRGLYTALLAARVEEARRRGYPYLTIDAGPMSRPLVERFGFRLLTHTTPCRWRVRNPRGEE
ncbi:MAG TPA: GNAT family N-acetyltransferase [Pyrinomonadaceae bacterium]|nr:GNAT family N-acetyltransferase [Pyrinomonadaceae bacterium]